jgi:hypothetical protein
MTRLLGSAIAIAAFLGSVTSAEAHCTPGVGYSIIFPSGLAECGSADNFCWQVLDMAAATWAQGGGTVRVITRADTVGTAEASRLLTDQRAGYLREQLAERGVSPDQIVIDSRGDQDLARPTADEIAEPLNNIASVELPEAFAAARRRHFEAYLEWAEAERGAGRVPPPYMGC